MTLVCEGYAKRFWMSWTRARTEADAKSSPFVILSVAKDLCNRLTAPMNEVANYPFAPLCISTVLQVLSSAWHRFSSGQSAHLGLRAMQSRRPCQMIW